MLKAHPWHTLAQRLKYRNLLAWQSTEMTFSLDTKRTGSLSFDTIYSQGFTIVARRFACYAALNRRTAHSAFGAHQSL